MLVAKRWPPQPRHWWDESPFSRVVLAANPTNNLAEPDAGAEVEPEAEPEAEPEPEPAPRPTTNDEGAEVEVRTTCTCIRCNNLVCRIRLARKWPDSRECRGTVFSGAPTRHTRSSSIAAGSSVAEPSLARTGAVAGRTAHNAAPASATRRPLTASQSSSLSRQ